MCGFHYHVCFMLMLKLYLRLYLTYLYYMLLVSENFDYLRFFSNYIFFFIDMTDWLSTGPSKWKQSITKSHGQRRKWLSNNIPRECDRRGKTSHCAGHFSITWTYLRNERDVYSRVRFDEFDKYLSSNVPQELCNTTSHDQLHFIKRQCFSNTFIVRVDWSHVHHSPSMCSLMKGSSIMLLWFVFKIFSNSVMSLFW